MAGDSSMPAVMVRTRTAFVAAETVTFDNDKPAAPSQVSTSRRVAMSPAKVTPFAGRIERASAAFDRRTSLCSLIIVRGARRGRIFAWRLEFATVTSRIHVRRRPSKKVREVLRRCAAENLFQRMKAQRAIAFELRFAEPLVGRRFMRERIHRLGVTVHVIGHRMLASSTQSRLDVEQPARRRALVDRVIVDAGRGAVQPDLGVAVGKDLYFLLEADRHAEVDANLADGIAEVAQLAVGIAAGIAHKNVAAATQDDFVQP